MTKLFIIIDRDLTKVITNDVFFTKLSMLQCVSQESIFKDI